MLQKLFYAFTAFPIGKWAIATLIFALVLGAAMCAVDDPQLRRFIGIAGWLVVTCTGAFVALRFHAFRKS